MIDPMMLAFAAMVVALMLAGIAGAACCWGYVQHARARRVRAYGEGLAAANEVLHNELDGVTAQLDQCVGWLTTDPDMDRRWEEDLWT